MRRGIWTQLIAITLAAGMLTACAGSTVIRSNPPGATVFLNGVPVGRTPYVMKDRKITGSTTSIRLEHEGYEPLDLVITRNEKVDALAVVGGIFLLVPLLWIMEYNPDHYFALNPGAGAPALRAGNTPPTRSRLPQITPPRKVQPSEGNDKPSEQDVRAQARKANELNAEGRDLLRDGKYEAAVAKFEHAVELLADPRFFFNLCVAHDGAGDKVQAVAACRAVKKHQPSERLRKKTDEMLDSMDAN